LFFVISLLHSLLALYDHWFVTISPRRHLPLFFFFFHQLSFHFAGITAMPKVRSHHAGAADSPCGRVERRFTIFFIAPPDAD